MNKVDARGLSCPEPVIRARQAIGVMGAETELEVLVDTVTSRENVLRTARSMGCQVRAEEHGDGFRVLICKP